MEFDFSEKLRQGASELNIELTQEHLEKFTAFKAYLLEWNKKINITRIVDDKDVLVKHFLDSLTVVKYIPEKSSVVDVGTGGGFPGVPIKIVRPLASLTLIDSLKKRLVFLDEAIKLLKFNHIKTEHIRAEDAGAGKTHRECYDVAVSRAVTVLPLLAEYCLPLVKEGGTFIAMKGMDVHEEVENSKDMITALGGKITDIDHIIFPSSGLGVGESISRSVIVIRKIRHCSPKYPRSSGVLAKLYK